ncbi:hypothetical protein B0H13DRAFT_2318796 [Mycena leptocephala]|nr:hypothetical protein B0H13DRAFT_2318796 [Mycena leptocephala]
MATVRPPPLNAPPQSAYSEPLVSRLFSPSFLCPTYATKQHQSQPKKTDLVYGYEYTAQLSARFITHLFACPPFPPQSTHWHLHQAVTCAALVLLQRLKSRFPTARGSSGHRLFISAFMIASKVICDDT